MPRNVNTQVTDGVTQADLTVLGTGPSMAIVQSELSLAQAQGVLFANMVSNQQNLALSTNAAMTEGIMQLLSGSKGRGKAKPDTFGGDNGPGLRAFNVPPQAPPEPPDEDRYADATMSLMVR